MNYNTCHLARVSLKKHSNEMLKEEEHCRLESTTCAPERVAFWTEHADFWKAKRDELLKAYEDLLQSI